MNGLAATSEAPFLGLGRIALAPSDQPRALFVHDCDLLRVIADAWEWARHLLQRRDLNSGLSNPLKRPSNSSNNASLFSRTSSIAILCC